MNLLATVCFTLEHSMSVWTFYTINSLSINVTMIQGMICFIIRENYLHSKILRDYYMTFPISALVSNTNIKPDNEAGVLIWVEGWYQGRYGQFHIIFYLSHILHWLFSSIYFHIAEKIFELTNCENKSLRYLPLFNLQICLFLVWFQTDIKQCRSVQWRQKMFVKSIQDVDIWMEIPIQHDVYIWANYSVSSY